MSHTGFGGQKIIVDPYSKVGQLTKTYIFEVFFIAEQFFLLVLKVFQTVVVLFRNAIEWDLRKEKLTDNIMKKVLLLDGGS